MTSGLPLWWLLGLTPFVPALFGLVLALLLLARPAIRVERGALPLITFALWSLASVVTLDSALGLVGFAVRWTAIAAAALVLLYVGNCGERRCSDRHILGALAVIWVTVIVGGYLGMLFPETELSTPMARVLPGPVMNNEFVRDLVMPRFAEVQRPWGAPEAFNRPSAPFPYTNGWGCALALLTPLMLALRERLTRPLPRAAIAAGLVASAVPAIATRNRGMLLVLAATVAWYLAAQALRGNLRAARNALVVAVGSAVALVSFGLLDLITERQSYSDTTTGRARLYEATFAEVLRSPVLGFGAPRPSVEIGVSLGTQGALWTYLFCSGFIGAALFLFFLVRVLWRSGLQVGAEHIWLQASVAGAVVACFFYGFDAVHLTVIALTSALLLRARYAPPVPGRAQVREQAGIVRTPSAEVISG